MTDDDRQREWYKRRYMRGERAITMWISEDLLAKVDAYTRQHGMNRKDFIVSLIERFFNEAAGKRLG